MQKKFNVIEVLVSRENWKPNLIIIIWENEKIEILDKKDIDSKLISILKIKNKMKKTNNYSIHIGFKHTTAVSNGPRNRV